MKASYVDEHLMKKWGIKDTIVSRSAEESKTSNCITYGDLNLSLRNQCFLSPNGSEPYMRNDRRRV